MPTEAIAATVRAPASIAILKPYFRLLRGQYRDVALVLLVMAISTAVTLAIPLYAGRFVDALGRHGTAWTDHTRLFGILALLLLLQLAGTFVYTVLSARLGLRTVTRLRRQLFAHLLELPALYFTEQKLGDLSSRLTGDVGSIQYMLTSGLVNLVRAVATLLGAVVLMFHLNVKLTLVVLLLVPATILLVHLFGRHLQRLSRRMRDELGQISHHVQEVAGAIRIVKVFNNQPHQRDRFDGRLQRFLGAGLRRAWLSAALESAAQIVLWICLIGVVVYGFTLTAHGETTPGQLVAFLLLAFRVAVPLSSLTSLYASAQGAVAAATRLDEIFAVAPESGSRLALTDMGETDAAGATDPSGAPWRRSRLATGATIELENVSFGYDTGGDQSLVLRDISLTIGAGQKVAVVGPSGAGKTTLTGLLLRLFDPSSGRLTLDGRPYGDYELTALRGQMAYVSQEPVLFDVSVEENIRFGLDHVDAEQVRTAAARAHALAFIERLPAGFATLCGDRGVKLSGGERQRIALARAFLRDPRILILDEPTSALDAASEAAVGAALEELMAGRTAVVIAHRLALVRDLDRLFVLADGRLVEEGSHGDLLAIDGIYAQLYRLHQGNPVAPSPPPGL